MMNLLLSFEFWLILVASSDSSPVRGLQLNAVGNWQGTTEMKTFDEYLRDAEVAHGHLCAGQVLGVRLAMLGLTRLGIDDPGGKDRKRLVTFVEIDRCATDAVAVVTGCRLGKRALKFRDWGKMAATFVDANTGKGVRIAAKESSKALARQMHPELPNKNSQQMLAYREMPEDDLFNIEWVKVDLPPEEFPGYKGERIVCEVCGEGINFRREVRRDGKLLCRGCAGERYYESA
jgi:formylmethanofuran dehydrogenase subunit E